MKIKSVEISWSSLLGLYEVLITTEDEEEVCGYFKEADDAETLVFLAQKAVDFFVAI